MKNTQMTDQELSKKIYRNLFTDSQWELIYNFIGNALDDQLFDSNDVYTIRNKIEALLNWNSNDSHSQSYRTWWRFWNS